MHNSSEFQLYTQVVNYASYVRKNLCVNIPKIHSDIRIHLQDESYNLVRTLYEAEFTKGNVRLKNITNLLVNISMLDFLTSELQGLECISKKNIEISLRMLTHIKNMTYAWKKSIEASDKKVNC